MEVTEKKLHRAASAQMRSAYFYAIARAIARAETTNNVLYRNAMHAARRWAEEARAITGADADE